MLGAVEPKQAQVVTEEVEEAYAPQVQVGPVCLQQAMQLEARLHVELVAPEQAQAQLGIDWQLGLQPQFPHAHVELLQVGGVCAKLLPAHLLGLVRAEQREQTQQPSNHSCWRGRQQERLLHR